MSDLGQRLIQAAGEARAMTKTQRLENEAALLWRALDRIAARRDMTLNQLAKAAGCRGWGYPKYRVTETGAITWPNLRTVALIFLRHGISWSELGATLDTIKLGQEAEHDIAA